MIKHTFFNKCNTILENSEYNTGLNPVAELNTGKLLSRILINFDIEPLRNSIKNGEINIHDLKHIIKMTNCGSINVPFSDNIISGCNEKERASSFNVIAFKLPYSFDEGKGFDYNGDYVKESFRKTSKDGSNWFNAQNGLEWDEHGVYFNKTLMNDYKNKFGITDDSVIIGEQHFDYGNENLEIDITEYLNDIIINDKMFNGIGLSFEPSYEINTVDDRFVSFFTNHTNTFFVPYLETINTNIINDNRYNFYLGCNNKLYLFVAIDGEYVNLDKLPKCTINNEDYEVKQNGRGIYYVDIKLSSNDTEPESILYDVWSNIILNGEKIEDIEMEFVVHSLNEKIEFSKKTSNKNIVPQVYGIYDDENISVGDIRELKVDFIEEYSYGKKIAPTYSEFRLYVKEGNREIDVFDFNPIEKKSDEYVFLIDTNDLMPNHYHIDIKIKNGRDIKYHKNVLEFSVISNVTNYYI